MNYEEIMAAALRQPGRAKPDPLAGSVMGQPAAPPPVLNEDLPIESVSPEDWIPNPKSLVAALKGLGPAAMVGMAKFKLPSMEKALMDASYTNNNAKSMAGIAEITPSQFLDATVPVGSNYVENRSGKVDPFKLYQQGLPELYLDKLRPQIKGHESRHRLSALRKAGIDTPLPVRVAKGYESGLMDDELRALGNRTLLGQDYGQQGRGAALALGNVEPMSWGNRDKILGMQQEVDIPLKNVGVLMKPEGPHVTEDDMRAFARGRVPYGTVPPPKPRNPE